MSATTASAAKSSIFSRLIDAVGLVVEQHSIKAAKMVENDKHISYKVPSAGLRV